MAVGGVAEVCTDFAPFVAGKGACGADLKTGAFVSHESPSRLD